MSAGFAAGALIISTLMGLLSYDLTRRTLLAGRERAAIRAAYVDAAAVQAGLPANDPGEVLQSLDTGPTRRAALNYGGTWYLRTADDGITEAIPAALQHAVSAGQPAVQRVATDAGAALVIGVPLSEDARFYVVDSLQELERTLQVLGLVVTLVAVGTTASGAALGAYVTRRALRPLATIANAARDITAGDLRARLDPAAEPELERLATAFNQMVDQLAQRLERDRRFAADVSHELRSPLQTLSAAVTVLSRRRDHLDARTAQAADLVHDEVTRFQALVTDLLELARADQEPDRTPVDMVQLAHHVCAAHHLPEDTVVVQTGSDRVWHVDRRRMEQVLTNLLDNARRHGGGVVAVVIGGDSTCGLLCVDDDGPGIPPADRAAVFHRFVRGRTAHARGDTDGTGLGLALVAQHVASHGGRVFATERPGGGARFHIEIPRSPR